jgi:hypothetical protein
MGTDELMIEIYPQSPDLDPPVETPVPDIYPFIELHLTCAGARELALILLAEADRADLLAHGGSTTLAALLN